MGWELITITTFLLGRGKGNEHERWLFFLIAHVGGMILRALETTALGLGCHRLVLETGTRQVEAMALYRRHGFAEIPCWGEYLDSAETSTCLGKDLG